VSDLPPSRSGLEDALRAPVRAVLGGPSRALTSAVAERVAEILIEEGVVERTVDRALSDPGTERAAIKVIDSELLDEITARLLASNEMQLIIERIATSPEVRSAITSQGVGLIDDLRRALAEQARRADLVVERPFRRLARHPPRTESPPYAGFVTRLLALALDGALFNGILLAVTALVAALANALGGAEGPDPLAAALAGSAAWLGGAGLYLVGFWTLVGQTPGMRFLGIELRRADGRARLSLGRSLRRLAGMAIGAIPFFAGYLASLLSERRRALHDRFADSVVLYREPSRPGLPKGPG
jgi:uncharacterized RDD family membrane protein YckC